MREMIGTFRTRTHSAGRRLHTRKEWPGPGEKIKRTPLCSKLRFFEMTMIRGISLSLSPFNPSLLVPLATCGRRRKTFPPFSFPSSPTARKTSSGCPNDTSSSPFFSFAAFAATRDRLTDLSLPLSLHSSQIMTMEVEGRAKLYHGAMTAAYLFIRGGRATVYAPSL